MREQTGGGSGGHGPKCAQSIVKAGKGGLKRLIIKMMSVSLAREKKKSQNQAISLHLSYRPLHISLCILPVFRAF